MRDIKIAIVDMAQGLKECRDRLSALEENRGVEKAQMNEKWTGHLRKIAKLERTLNALIKTKDRGS